MKKSNKKKILGIMSKIGNFINKAQPIVGDIPPEKEPEENQPKKEEIKVKKEVKNFNLQIEDDVKAEYDLNDDDDDEEEEEEEDDDNEEKDKKKENENNEESTNDNDSSIEKKEEEKKAEIKEEKKEENVNNLKEEKKENNEEKKLDKENKEINKEEKKEKVEIKEEKKIEEKKEVKKEEIKEDKKQEIKEEKNKKKEETKEIKNEKKEDSTKKKENIQKPKNINKPASKSTQQKKEIQPKPISKNEENEVKQNLKESPSLTKEKPKLKFQKKPKAKNKNKICHYFLKKGTDIDIKEYDFYMVKKVKKQKSMFSKLNNLGINLNLNIKFGGINKVSNKINSFFKKKPKDIKYTDYYLIINENFIYFCKDAEIFANEPDKKRIGSCVPFNNITKIEINKEGEMHKIIFDIQFRTLNKIKEFYADNEIYGELLEIFHEFKKEYNLDYNIEIKENK